MTRNGLIKVFYKGTFISKQSLFQREKWFVYQTTWFKARLWIFFSENWCKFLILLIKTNNSIKIKPWFQFEVFFFWEDENNWLLKLWYLKTSEAPINPILKIQKKILRVCWFLGNVHKWCQILGGVGGSSKIWQNLTRVGG